MTRVIHREPVSSRLLYLQEMDVNRMRDDVKTEASAVELKLRKSVVHFGG